MTKNYFERASSQLAFFVAQSRSPSVARVRRVLVSGRGLR